MTDRWAAWLLERRFGSDQRARERMLGQLGEIRDRVLAGARIGQGDVVLDVGCGDGLLGVAACNPVGDTGTVIFSDVSEDLLERCREITAGLGVAGRSRFVHTGLPGLEGIETGSVDVALTRSVLIYVPDKAAAFATLRRVLRPGGRLSIFEPINRFSWPEPDELLWGFDVTGLESIAAKVKDAYRVGRPEGDPMLDFDERDLLELAGAAGFTDLRLDYRADIGVSQQPTDLAVFLRTAPNPLVPTTGEVLDAALEGAERAALLERLAGQLGSGARRQRHAVAYLTARH